MIGTPKLLTQVIGDVFFYNGKKLNLELGALDIDVSRTNNRTIYDQSSFAFQPTIGNIQRKILHGLVVGVGYNQQDIALVSIFA